MANDERPKKHMSFEFYFSFFSKPKRPKLYERILNQIQILYIKPISNKIEPKKKLNIAPSRF